MPGEGIRLGGEGDDLRAGRAEEEVGSERARQARRGMKRVQQPSQNSPRDCLVFESLTVPAGDVPFSLGMRWPSEDLVGIPELDQLA